MAEKFDPYRTWLGIPPDEQPPNHYRLLGIGLFESLPDVIGNAADRQMIHVRSFQSGKYSKLSQQILNELSSARVCLLNPDKKARYDAELRAKLVVVGPPLPPGLPLPPLPVGEIVSSDPLAPAEEPPFSPLAAPARRTTTRRSKGKKNTISGTVIGFAVAGVGAAVVIVFLMFSGGSTPEPHRLSADSDRGESATISHSHDHALKHASSSETANKTDLPSKPTYTAFPNVIPAPPEGLPDHTPQPREGIPAKPKDDASASVGPGFGFKGGAPGEIGQLAGHTGRVTGVAFDVRADRLVSAGDDMSVRLWDWRQRREIRTFAGCDQPVLKIAVTEHPENIVAITGTAGAGKPTVVRTWKRADQFGEPTVELPSLAWDLAVSEDNHTAVFACQDGKIYLYKWKTDAARTQPPEKLVGHEGPVRAVALSADRSRALSGGEDRSVRFWNVTEPAELHRMNGHRGPVTCTAISADGHFGASGSSDGTVRIWELNSFKQRRLLAGHVAALTGVAFLSDSKRLLSTSEDGTLRLWNLANAREIWRFAGHNGPLRCVAVSNDDLTAVTGGDDHTVRIWQLPAADAKPQPLADLPVQPVEVDHLAERVAAAESLPTATMPVAQRRSGVEKGLALAHEIIAAERWEEAGKVLAALKTALPKIHDPHLAKQTAALSVELEQLQTQARQVQPAREKLRTQPDDPAANEALGRYLCLQRNSWNEGLPKLARGADAELKKAAQADLDAPESVESQLAVADGWWARAEKETGIGRQSLRNRACWWYAMIEADASGETLVRVKKLLAEAGIDGNR
jgi:WD40 repeat protein